MNVEIILVFRYIGKLFVLICVVIYEIYDYFLRSIYLLKLVNFSLLEIFKYLLDCRNENLS